MITIQELLYNRGLDKNAEIKLIRHKDKRYPDLYDWYRTDRQKFLTYQNAQGKDILKGYDYIVSFIGEEENLSRFVGVFKVIDKVSYDTPIQIDIFPNVRFNYQMEEVQGFEDLKERIIIKWGNPISWHQRIKNDMEVIEIHPGLHYKQFTDYSDFILDFEELKEIINNQYSDWKKMLSVTKGIYLISDTNTGKLYVGSAYGDDGIWGRWSTYVSTNGHGWNKILKELIDNEPNYGSHFQFSILMLLPKTITADEAIKKRETF